jgi:hypothetical protein
LVEIKNDNTDEFNKGIDTDTEIESF